MDITSAIELFYELHNTVGNQIMSILKEVGLKDKYGQIWDISNVEFSEKITTLRLRLGGTENYRIIVLNLDSLNEYKDYELIKKESSNQLAQYLVK